MPDYTVSAATQCGPEAFGRAGVRPDEVDMAMFYDSFTITVLMLLEDMGFCKKGEGGSFVAEGHHQARRPPAASIRTAEACPRTIRACAGSSSSWRRCDSCAARPGEAQVPDCELAVAVGSGGWLSCIGAVVLGKGGA